MEIIRGKADGKNCKIAIVMSLFNEFIGQKLLEGTLSGLKGHNVPQENIDVYKVPGAFELPVTADKLASLKKYDAIICLGAVIRGGTPHFEYVAGAANNGILNVSLKYQLPVIFGVLTTDTVDQAVERADTKGENKGRESAITALEMIDLFKKLS